MTDSFPATAARQEPAPPNAEAIACAFHEAYERLAPLYGYETRRESNVPWESVPEPNRALMIATVDSLIADGVIL